ncbi:MAG: hypothetical protein LBV07_02725 [Syntrophobacterales bacterium]|jgi:hypothetical protein|nr:hypothetical protein [Syntrophobacterales bacterium]
MDSGDNKASKDDMVLAVKTGMVAFSMVVKNHALYPETNTLCQNSLLKFKEWLDNFLLHQDSLQLFVEKDCLLFQQEIVLQDKPGEQTMAQPFFRDGVQWFEFLYGITIEELRMFIILLNRFRILREEAEDDLVTALWEANFLYIQYKTANEFWEIEPFIDFGNVNPNYSSAKEPHKTGEMPFYQSETFGFMSGIPGYRRLSQDGDQTDATSGFSMESKSTPESPHGGYASPFPGSGYEVSPDQHDEASHAKKKFSFLSSDLDDAIFMQRNDKRFWKLSKSENALIQDMIFEEEHRNTTHDCLDVLFILLTSHNNKAIGSAVLNFLLDEMQYALSQEDFIYIHHFLVRLNHLSKSPDPSKPWLVPFILDFQKKIASPSVLEALNDTWTHINTLTDATIDELRQILLLMTPEVVHALARTLMQTENPRIESMLIEIIAIQVCRSSADMSDAIRRLKSPLLRQLINILKSQEPYPAGLLIKLVNHESDLVQEEAVKALLHLNSRHIADIFHLMHGASPKIKRLICLQLAQKMDPKAEGLLLNYLMDSQKQNKELDRIHIVDCYRALACGSSPKTVHFLHETLLKKGWRSLLGIENQFHLHRLGAALALMLMPKNEEAKIILEKALRNSHLSISSAYWQAKEELNKSEKGRVLTDG